MDAPRTDAGRAPGVGAPERLLHRLEWQVIRRLDGLLQGNYRTAFRGVGTDFLDLREYEPGDDVRHIDWNVTARMDTPFARLLTRGGNRVGAILFDAEIEETLPPRNTRNQVLALARSLLRPAPSSGT